MIPMRMPLEDGVQVHRGSQGNRENDTSQPKEVEFAHDSDGLNLSVIEADRQGRFLRIEFAVDGEEGHQQHAIGE